MYTIQWKGISSFNKWADYYPGNSAFEFDTAKQAEREIARATASAKRMGLKTQYRIHPHHCAATAAQRKALAKLANARGFANPVVGKRQMFYPIDAATMRVIKQLAK